MKLFDAHLHIIDPRFPLQHNDGFVPAPFTCADYRARMTGYELVGGAVVAGSFQGFDQRYLVSALEALGSGFVGVTQLPRSVADDTLADLHNCGVRALRFNIKRGGSESVGQLRDMALRVHTMFGWHVELYIDARELKPLVDTILSLPRVSIDHLGLSRDGFTTVLQLAEKGVGIKATGFSRGDLDVRGALRDLYTANPACLMFGSDLPSTRAPRPFSDADHALVLDTLGDSAAQAVFYENAMAFYR